MDARGKEDEKGKIPNFETHDLTKMEDVRKGNQLAKKNLFIADMNGKLMTALAYNQYVSCVTAHGEFKKVLVQKSQSKAEAGAEIRKQILSSIRHGTQTVLDIDTMVAIWKDYDELKPFFDYDNFMANWKTIIKPEENFDKHNNKDFFEPTDQWNIIIYFNNSGEFSDDETVQMNIDEIVEAVGQDVWNKWQKVYVAAEE